MENAFEYMTILENILSAEVKTLNDLYACQKRLYETVVNRNWIQFQKLNEQKESIVSDFLILEKNREAILSTMGGAGTFSDFYHITASLPDENRTTINSLFREMRRLLLLSKTENDILSAYTENARNILSGMLETVIPARKNKIYSRRGDLVAGKVESLVLNRTF